LGTWSSAPLLATDGTPLPYMTDVALLQDGLVALMAPSAAANSPIDCAVVTPVPTRGVTLAPYRYPMLNQSAPRFAAVPGPDVHYIGPPARRRLLPLPYPAYLTAGALGGFGLSSHDPDCVWHRLYAEAHLPAGTSFTAWTRAAEAPVSASDQAAI